KDASASSPQCTAALFLTPPFDTIEKMAAAIEGGTGSVAAPSVVARQESNTSHCNARRKTDGALLPPVVGDPDGVQKQVTGIETRVALQGALKAAGMDSAAEEDLNNSAEQELEAQHVNMSEQLRSQSWTFLFVIALGSLVGAVNVLFHKMVSKGTGILEAAGEGMDPNKRWVFATYRVLVAVAGASVVGWLTRNIVPECLGGGTIATKISLAIGSPIPFRVGLARLLLSSLYVASGNPLGIEAPTIHLSAAVASTLHSISGIEAVCNFQLPLCMVLGCCGGLSAAFNSPLSGIVFAIEEYMDIRQEGMVTALVLLSSFFSSLLTRLTIEGPMFPIEGRFLDSYETIPWRTLLTA
ncbi:unnamed protein product, partial [Amoebophrya sp. A25]